MYIQQTTTFVEKYDLFTCYTSLSKHDYLMWLCIMISMMTASILGIFLSKSISSCQWTALDWGPCGLLLQELLGGFVFFSDGKKREVIKMHLLKGYFFLDKLKKLAEVTANALKIPTT